MTTWLISISQSPREPRLRSALDRDAIHLQVAGPTQVGTWKHSALLAGSYRPGWTTWERSSNRELSKELGLKERISLEMTDRILRRSGDPSVPQSCRSRLARRSTFLVAVGVPGSRETAFSRGGVCELLESLRHGRFVAAEILLVRPFLHSGRKNPQSDGVSIWAQIKTIHHPRHSVLRSRYRGRSQAEMTTAPKHQNWF